MATLVHKSTYFLPKYKFDNNLGYNKLKITVEDLCQWLIH
jgi:hypothetical protein